ncbi:transcription factor IIA subunit alpha [Coemansia guatemalensis]|uniref:Transcription initiation factor IIA large subunit n=1 Tax=Coemansia guatemalensis TaxID=2761395 RepID=A0A9W8LT45_9FUNG|nr:transcription factor IIA subunit alpha [Coemansia guatemalensis]
MSNTIVAAIYRYVIDDVVGNVQADFEGHGVDTSVLEELQRSWEAKIIQSRVASFPNEDAIGMGYQHAVRHNTAADQNSGTYASYQHASAEAANVNSAASLASIINNPEAAAPSAASLASLAQSGRGQLLEDDDDAVGAGDADLRRRYPRYGDADIPQNDGAADSPPLQRMNDSDALAKWQALRDARRAAALPQLDGADDDDDEDDSSRAGNGHGDAPKVELPEDAINSDLDDSDDEYDDGEGEETEHIILCQYDKVTRSKNKWKCVLRDGIMLINGRDFLFQKANGDFEW